MYYLNKLVSILTSPAMIAMIVFVIGFAAAIIGRKRIALWTIAFGALWCGVWTSPVTYRYLASGLEMKYPVRLAEEMPQADAIRILGGGVAANTNEYVYSEMWTSADRVWHGARLYKAGKAPRIFVTNQAEVPLLVDFGVPREAITVCDKARNTEEEARFIADAMKEVRSARCEVRGEEPKVLLVTSAWHMRRAMLMFQRYAPELEVIPAATDYEALVRCGWKSSFEWDDFIPNAEMLFQSSYMVKEIVGYWGYKWFR